MRGAVHEVVHAGKTLIVAARDLAGDSDDILRHIAGVASRIRRLVAAATMERAPA